MTCTLWPKKGFDFQCVQASSCELRYLLSGYCKQSRVPGFATPTGWPCQPARLRRHRRVLMTSLPHPGVCRHKSVKALLGKPPGLAAVKVLGSYSPPPALLNKLPLVKTDRYETWDWAGIELGGNAANHTICGCVRSALSAAYIFLFIQHLLAYLKSLGLSRSALLHLHAMITLQLLNLYLCCFGF